MIRFALRCDRDHRFDAWFASGTDFDRQRSEGMVACAVCGSTTTDKDLMAPQVTVARDADLSAPASPAEQALAELRRHVETECEDVGRGFAAEARRIHEGQAPRRGIVGEARPADARALIEDGIPVAPLPWPNARRSN